MTNLDPDHAPQSMAPDLNDDDRQRYLLDEFEKIFEMLDGAEDCKWIYQALLNLGFLHRKVTGNLPRAASEWERWIDVLTNIDPLRLNRWSDMKDILKT